MMKITLHIKKPADLNKLEKLINKMDKLKDDTDMEIESIGFDFNDNIKLNGEQIA